MTITASWLDALAARERRYFAVDGGAGATVLALLRGVDPRLRPADSPRHASTLIVAEPVTEAFAAAVREAYAALSHPRLSVVVGDRASADGSPRVEDLVSMACRVPAESSPLRTAVAVAAAACEGQLVDAPLATQGDVEEVLLPLREDSEREIATEDVVVSIGPIQNLAAGPLQLLLTTDGEQIVRCEVRTGFAARGVEERLRAAAWSAGPAVAEAIDPIAPITGRLAYVTALEQLADFEVPLQARKLRDRALRLERAASQLVWLTRFATVIAYDRLAATARRLASTATECVPNAAAVVVGGWDEAAADVPPRAEVLSRLRDSVQRLAKDMGGSRALAIRARGVGTITAERAAEIGASGPIRQASERGRGDIMARIAARLREALDDLAAAAAIGAPLSGEEQLPVALADSVPAGRGEASVRGPRGDIRLTLESDGGDRPTSVGWTRSSQVHLDLIPEVVINQTLPDALATVASLDLSMAEADG